jgi:hypothetical protein
VRKLVLLLLVAPGALAYNEAIHEFITRSALPDDRVLQPPRQQDLDAFRALFWRKASATPAFAQRFPTPQSFDAWAFKEFLMLDPAARVHGFDLFEYKPMTRGELLALASRWPDDDVRNQHRYLRDPRTREIVKATDGSPMPYDPATLDFGSLSGTTSQGHAHYGLVDGPLSDDPEVLKKDPRRFAVPPTAHAYGAELAQLYTDLAALALESGSDWLAATFAGAAFHHIEDVCNQIHTVQVGIYEFFESAFLQSKWRDVKTLGGLLGERRSLKQIGLRLIANHHLMSEDLFARHQQGRIEPDPSLDKAGSALALTKRIIDISSQEGPQVYRLAWTFSVPTLRDGVSGHEYQSNKDDPNQFVDHSKKEALDQFFELENRGLRRAVSALRVWQREFPGPPHDPVPELLAYHAQTEKRRAGYQPASPARMGIAWGYPAAAAALLLIAGALIWSRLSKRS